MRVFFTCVNCKKHSYFSCKATDRAELANRMGENIERTCQYCGHCNKVHVNRIYAKENKWFVIPVLLIGITATIITVVVLMKSYWRNDIGRDLYAISAFGIGLVVPLLIMFTALSGHSKKTQAFNSYRL